MKFPIGFALHEEPPKMEPGALAPQAVVPIKSLVQVYFPECDQTLTYFNNQFDLKPGNFVFVEGKLEGIRGIVREVNRNFKIKTADYRKVISVADTTVSGQLYMAGSHFVSFDPGALPYEKVRTWYLPPIKEEDEYEVGSDGTAFLLDKLGDMPVSPTVWERGRDYYMENRVCCLCVKDGHGRAIVVGNRAYEVEFTFVNGEIRNLLCTCPCGYTCKHEVAALLQLKETLEKVDKHYSDLYHGNFATVAKGDFFRFAIDGHETGSFVLSKSN